MLIPDTFLIKYFLCSLLAMQIYPCWERLRFAAVQIFMYFSAQLKLLLTATISNRYGKKLFTVRGKKCLIFILITLVIFARHG